MCVKDYSYSTGFAGLPPVYGVQAAKVSTAYQVTNASGPAIV